MYKEDIFDRIMRLPMLRMFNPFYKKYKEVLLYLFFGGLAFLISIGSYAVFNIFYGINELLANVFSWIITVSFAYLTNKIWVFHVQTIGIAETFRQMAMFFGGRIITLVIEELILFVFITWLHFPGMVIKVLAQIIVIFLNYIISKLLIFKGK